MRNRVRIDACGLLAALALMATSAQAERWVQIKTPPNAEVQTIASDMLLNGRACRLMRFNVRASEADVLAFYRAEMGAKRVVENRLKGDPVIATRQGDYFVTVQLHVLDSQTIQGTVMATLLTTKPASGGVLVDTEADLPTATQVISSVETTDAGKHSLVLVGINLNSVAANRDHIVEALLARGFRVTSEDARDERDGTVVSLQLSSAGEEAAVTISNDGKRRAIVINRVRERNP